MADTKSSKVPTATVCFAQCTADYVNTNCLFFALKPSEMFRTLLVSQHTISRNP